jgi:hypothetical protein
MSVHRRLPVWAKVAFVALLVVSGAPACDEGGEKLPARCSDTNGDGMVDPLPLDDLGSAGFPDAENPCLTPVGDAISYIENYTPTAGTSTGGTSTAGTSPGGAPSGQGGAPTGQGGADAGAGGS